MQGEMAGPDGAKERDIKAGVPEAAEAPGYRGGGLGLRVR